ncbi:presequence protease, mitochondrial-like [Anneissia japonica]|uniref:presequence protease, mitochondrial-like n=1 Tax=Anneissia japonica TaxID=1529436 RepID=UPI0014255286|nr:presequence protease, mitochondrial-like [Anneissia japonica]
MFSPSKNGSAIRKCICNARYLSKRYNFLSKLRQSHRCNVQARHCASVSALQRVESYKPGECIHGFTVEKIVNVPELYLSAVKLSHDATGAQYLHVAREDSNNVFSVAFRTTPMDSTGVSHILEHSALCGSQKYPCRDPFFKMLNRSLSTFMNAFTGSDYTVYPFSTQNSTDFSNLMSVYLDATFFPKLQEQDFRQEGWRLENEDNQDPTSPIIFKGVVYNEMKGAMASADSLFATHCQNKLFPSHTYSHNSGGDPSCIPDLTWQQLKQFHASHYHPSNARFYTYGNRPLEESLQQIDTQVLRRFGKIQPDTVVPDEARWTEPREAEVYCTLDPMAADPTKQTTVNVSYLLGRITDPFESFTASVLGTLLVSGPTSPFYKALLEANIGSDYSPVVGYDNSTKEASFSVGLQGIATEDVEKVKDIIQQTFQKVAVEGFDDKRIEAILHKIELSQKHQTTNFGLGLLMALLSCWNHEADPTDHLKINDMVTSFKHCLENNPKWLEEKVEEYFLKNQHRLTLVMKPKENFQQELDDQEAQKIVCLTENLSTNDRQTIFEDGLKLAEEQSKEDDPSCLPTLAISDIDRDIIRTVVDLQTLNNVSVQHCIQPTNGVVYFRAVASLHTLPDELLTYVPLFSSVITQMGAGDMSFHEFSQQEDLKTGGLGVKTYLCQHPESIHKLEKGITLSSYCLDNNTEEMFRLWQEIFLRPKLDDVDRFTTLVRMNASDLAMSLSNMGHSFAMSAAQSNITPVGHFSEIMSGMMQVKFLKSVAEMQDMSPVLQKLQQVSRHVLSTENMRCALNASPLFMDTASLHLERYLSQLPGEGAAHTACMQDIQFNPTMQKLHYELPFPVNYVSRAIEGVPYTHEDFASLRILARLMSSKFLHREIREKGGAYGGGASMGTSGAFTFYSYRDPNSEKTIKAFSDSIQWAVDANYSQQDIDEAKLSVFSAVDSPTAPSSKGMRLFSSHISDEIYQRHRQQLLAVTQDDMVKVAKKYLLKGDKMDGTALLGPANEFTKGDEQWTIKKEE